MGPMSVIIVGCGRVGAELAYRLFLRGHQVTVIDEDAATFRGLRPDFRGRLIEGEALNRDVLQRAGIEQVDAVAAVSNSDALNTVVAHVARAVYHVPNVVVRSYDPRWRPVQEEFGFQMISPSSWGAQRLEELIYQSTLHTVFSAGNGEVDIYELAVPEAWYGRKLEELRSEGKYVPVALTRAGSAMLPSNDLELEAGDILLLGASLEGFKMLRQRLDTAKEA
jgi:trk system potassium uptake protein